MLGFDSLFKQYQPKCLVLWISSLAKGGSPMSRNFYERTRVNKVEAVYGKSRVNLKVKRGSTFYVYERPCIQIAAILFTRAKVLCAYAHKIYLTAEFHPKGGCTWRLNLLSGVLF